jgi:hypothetical protein
MPNSYDIGSDGEAREWKESMLLNAELLGYGFKLPPSFRSDPDKNQVEKEVIEFLAHEIIRNSNSSKKNKM